MLFTGFYLLSIILALQTNAFEVIPGQKPDNFFESDDPPSKQLPEEKETSQENAPADFPQQPEASLNTNTDENVPRGTLPGEDNDPVVKGKEKDDSAANPSPIPQFEDASTAVSSNSQPESSRNDELTSVKAELRQLKQQVAAQRSATSTENVPRGTLLGEDNDHVVKGKEKDDSADKPNQLQSIEDENATADSTSQDEELVVLKAKIRRLELLAEGKSAAESNDNNQVEKINEITDKSPIYDYNFDNLKEIQDQQRKTSEEFSDRLPQLWASSTAPDTLSLLVKILNNLPDKELGKSRVCNDLTDDIMQVIELLEKLKHLLKNMIASLHIINYWAFYPNNLIDTLINQPHNVVLTKNVAQDLLMNSLGNINNFADEDIRNFVNLIISIILKSVDNNTVPSYFLINMAKVFYDRMTRLQTSTEEMFRELLRKFKMILENLLNLNTILKSAKEENVESIINIIQQFHNILQKMSIELSDNAKNLNSWIRSSASNLKTLGTTRPNDKILDFINKS
ncbi:MAG: hypothetical protein LBE97_00460 [Holosporales bacterium]|jgi:hypothetical protein|nr:hypothetical protein [Holosporales bacterium]